MDWHEPVQKRLVKLESGRPPIAYDALSLDIGITPSAEGVPGALQHATPVKPVSRYPAVPSSRRKVSPNCILVLHACPYAKPDSLSYQQRCRIFNSRTSCAARPGRGFEWHYMMCSGS